MGLFKKLLLAAAIAGSLLVPGAAWAIATLLPNGEQTFLDNNGEPLASGSVYFYIPSTTTPKTTWLDAGQTTPNTNPVVLDSAGRAIIYGSGQYRQLVKDSAGNTIWDQPTQDLISLLNGNSIIWGGTSTGSANAQVISPSPASTSLSAGQYFAFLPGNTNTSGTTLQVSALGAVALKKRTTAGLQSLAGNDLITGQVYLVVYDGTQFELQDSMPGINSIPTIASGTTTDLGSVTNLNISISGVTTINSFGSSAVIGDLKFLTFQGVLTITYNVTSMIIPGAASVTTAAGDTALAVYLGSSNWRISSYTRAATVPGGGATTVVRRTVTGTDSIITSDQGKMVEATSGTFVETLTAPATLGNGFWVYWKNSGTGVVTLTPAAGQIDGLASFPSYPNETRLITGDGSNFFSTVLSPFSITYTAGATFTQPPGYKATMADAIGAGGGGGGGRGGSAGTTRVGGAGGGGGEHIRGGPFVITANTAVTITVGIAGAVGTGGSAGNGVNGGAGGSSSFGSYILAHGGSGGAGGTAAVVAVPTGGGCMANVPMYSNGTNQAGPGAGALAWAQLCGTTDDGAGGRLDSYGEWAGGAGGNGGTNTSLQPGFTSLRGGGGGGGGGGVSSGNTEGAGQAGGAGNTFAATGGGGAGGAVNGGAGTAGSVGTLGNGGNGGGGGGGQDSGTAGAGAAGGAPGGGGGGGGAGTSVGGAGALGGLGQVIVWGM